MGWKMRLSTCLVAAISSLLGHFCDAVSGATAYPERPVHIIVGFSPGANTDLVARLLGQRLAEIWHQPVIVEDKPGADGTIADSLVAHAAPDGYTLLVTNNNHVVAPNLHAVDYDTVRDFQAVSLIGSHGFALVVNPSYLTVASYGELISLVHSRPGKLNFGSTGPSSAVYLAMKSLAQQERLDMINVTYKGGAPVIIALLGGEIQLAFQAVPDLLPHIQKGELKALAVSSDFRDPLLPNVPTVAETAHLPEFNFGSWEGILAPAGIPKDVLAKLNHDVVQVVHLPEVEKVFIDQGTKVIASSPEYFSQMTSESVQRYAALLKATGN